MMTWIVLAGALGAGLYLKSKQSATTRWFMGTDEDLRKTPLAKIVMDLKTGLQLPEPPQGFHWKPVKIVIATNPLIAPDEIEINVLQQWLNDAPKPDGVSAFMSAAEFAGVAGGGGGHHHRRHGGGGGTRVIYEPWPAYDPFYYQQPLVIYAQPPVVIGDEDDEEEKAKKKKKKKAAEEQKLADFLTQRQAFGARSVHPMTELESPMHWPTGSGAFLISEQVGNPSALGSMGAYDLESFITTEAAADAPHGEDFVRYTLTDEHTMPNHGLDAYPEVAQAVAQAMQNLAPMLQWKGLALVCIPVATAGQGDFLFTSDRKLVVIRFSPPYGPVMVQEITPNRGTQYQMDRSRAVCALGVRR